MEQSPTIFIVSGSTGASGTTLVRTALAQFQNQDVMVVNVPQVRRVEQLEAIVQQAVETNGIIVHTLVNSSIRSQLVALAQAKGVSTIDLMGALLHQLSQRLGELPLGQPGRYRVLHEQDLQRIDAIRFTVEHDDGKRAFDLPHADVVLTGVSRVGKTPLSVYLSTMGWKVANIPLARNVEPPAGLFEIDHRRVIGLTTQADRLVAYRQHRGHDLGLKAGSSYSDPKALILELEYAQDIFRKGRFTVVDTTDRSIEENADEIITILTRRLATS
jgi:hypothetical protein